MRGIDAGAGGELLSARRKSVMRASLRAAGSAGILAGDAGSEAAIHGHRAGVGLV